MNLVVRIKKISTSALVPARSHEGDAGFDLYADEDKVIGVLARERVRTGIALEIPAGFEGQIRPRSGLAEQFGVTVLNAPGTLDSSFRGEVEVLLINLGSQDFDLSRGRRIAQVVFSPVLEVHFQEVADLAHSPRGPSGFGSSGR